MATLIFDNVLAGHHLEYIHHIYNGARNRIGEEFVFAVPKQEWDNVREKCEWPHADNIRWVMLDDEECKKALDGSMLTRCFKLSKLIKKVALKEKVDCIKLISLAGVIPFLPLMLPNNIKLSGIIYKIYLRASKTGIRRIIDYLRYTIMAKSRSMDKVFILNDSRSAKNLNKIYKTNRFITLADPVPRLNTKDIKDLRNELKIPDSSTVFLHFGAMDERKGTIEILRAINLLTERELKNRYFIFAGRVNDRIKDEFYHLAVEANKKRANIIVKDEFCSYGLLYSLCNTSDCILIPYLLTDLSSGALGYAALFKKPVIGPAGGLIGDLITTYNLGYTIDHITSPAIALAIKTLSLKPLNTCYAEVNTLEKFTSTFLQPVENF